MHKFFHVWNKILEMNVFCNQKIEIQEPSKRSNTRIYSHGIFMNNCFFNFVPHIHVQCICFYMCCVECFYCILEKARLINNSLEYHIIKAVYERTLYTTNRPIRPKIPVPGTKLPCTFVHCLFNKPQSQFDPKSTTLQYVQSIDCCLAVYA